MIEESKPNEVKARYGIEVEEFVEDERWEMGAEMRRVVDCIACDLLRNSVREV